MKNTFVEFFKKQEDTRKTVIHQRDVWKKSDWKGIRKKEDKAT